MKLGYTNGKPILPVTFTGEKGSIEVIALVDSGAEYCTFPPTICRDIGLARVGTKNVIIPGATMKFEEYLGAIQINGSKLSRTEILAVDLATPEIDALIGRNVLNNLKVGLDGKDKTLSIQDP